jgi:hypothetical protein
VGQKAPVVYLYSSDGSVTLTPQGTPEGQKVNLSTAGVSGAVVAAVLGANSTANGTNNNTLAADAGMTLTFAHTGRYALSALLLVSEATASAGGFQFDFGSGTATITDIQFAVNASGNVVISAPNAFTSATSSVGMTTVATSASSPSWISVQGQVNITVAGTLALRWAQNSASLDVTSLQKGSYLSATLL